MNTRLYKPISRACALIFTMALNVSDAPAANSAFSELFNGKDLSGWIVDGTKSYVVDGVEKPVWTVGDGVIRCAGQGFGFLRYDQSFDDFELRLEYRLSPGCNSGVGIRHGKYTGEHHTRPSRAGYEIQLLDESGKEPTIKSTGSLYRYVAPRSIPLKSVGQWNELQVECRGPRIRIRLNGETIQDVDQSTLAAIATKPQHGYVSLQNHGGRVAFRNVRIKELVKADAP